jgi:hypothetical protein
MLGWIWFFGWLVFKLFVKSTGLPTSPLGLLPN